MAMLYTHSIVNPQLNTMVVFKMRDSIPSARYSPFVMYCVNGKPRSSLFIESTDSMILRRVISVKIRSRAILLRSKSVIIIMRSLSYIVRSLGYIMRSVSYILRSVK